MCYVHYGSCFDISKWEEIQNEGTKPSGGFWMSPENAEYGWKDFCAAEDFRPCNEKHCFSLTSDARVLHIHSVSQLRYLPFVDNVEDFFHIRFHRNYLDYENLSQYYDAVEVHYSELDWQGVSAEDSELSSVLNGWDCDSIVVMNPNILIPLSEERN